MNINLTTEELAIAQEAIENMATAKGITPEQAAKDLFAMGINAWRQMEFTRKLTERGRHD